jgi:transposase
VVSEYEHSRNSRRVADRGVGGRALLIELSVRRLYCANPDCGKATFVEQVPGLTERYQRRTPGLRAVVEAVGVALAGRAGSRLLLALGVMVSWMTVLNIVMRIPLPQVVAPRALAVDDFALRRGRRYGTLVVDAESRLPIEVWDTRDAAPLAVWLAARPQVEVVCRDGSHTFRAAISTGAPKAVQVSDRFHLWQGLGARSTRWSRDTAPICPSPRTASVPPRSPAGVPPPGPAACTPPCTPC